MSKLLFCLQMWRGDAEAASSLLRLLADVAPDGKYPEADLLVSFTHDAPANEDAIRYAARAFGRVHTFRCQKGPEGWPCGPNHQAEQTWRYFVASVRSGRWNYSGIFLAEPDGIPCSRDWLVRVASEWDKCGANALGCFVPQGPSGVADHVNGNLILSAHLSDIRKDFARAPRDIAWDWHYRKFLMEQAKPSETIFSDYKTPSTDPEVLIRERHFVKGHPQHGTPVRPAWLHGTKNWQVVHQAMREFLQIAEKSSEKPVDTLAG
jgi:hypothetical protein